eukprot:TRINITY_DN2275_c0_g1_i1.p1 TRINITY_DN2275_c0_g1~~TRINITY_DN2275_c0_g1_i1.p1  ORF type:complete len:405 (-),score=109.91 TRINITY_DN2275_c0_g1_i1:188-1402(-)
MDLKGIVESAIGGNYEVHACAIVRLYTGTSYAWSNTYIQGAGAVATDAQGMHYLYIVDITTRTVAFSQEMYDNFIYDGAQRHFHSFETDDAVGGFSFVDTDDASVFYEAVSYCINEIAAQQAQQKRLPPKPPVSTPSKIPNAPTPAPITQSNTPTYTSPNSLTPKPAPTSQPKKKKGFMSSLMSKLTGDDDLDDLIISDPRGFRHESHIGWDPSAGFEIKNIPPEWRKLFSAAGVKKSELRDAETAKFVMNVIGDVVAQGGTSPYNPPPAPPTPQSNAPPRSNLPPPPPPITGSIPGGMPPPPPPAMPKKSMGPPPPPPPTNNASASPATQAPKSNDSRGDLLSAIQKGKELRKVDPTTPQDLPDLGTINKNDLVGTLSAAMAQRRGALREEDEEDEEEDEWSD